MVLPAVIAMAGCATAAGDDDGLDDGGTDDDPDAAPGQPDGGGSNDEPDAAVGTPDAAPGLPDAAPPPPDASTGVPCASGATCGGAITLASVSGDTGDAPQTIQGHQSAWYKVRFTEDDHGIFGRNLRFSLRLTSPATASFDVFVYGNFGSDTAQECSMLVGTTNSAGNVDTVTAEWGEGSVFSNNSEDGRNLSIEVRNVSGTCSIGDVWRLELRGNQ